MLPKHCQNVVKNCKIIAKNNCQCQKILKTQIIKKLSKTVLKFSKLKNIYISNIVKIL